MHIEHEALTELVATKSLLQVCSTVIFCLIFCLMSYIRSKFTFKHLYILTLCKIKFCIRVLKIFFKRIVESFCYNQHNIMIIILSTFCKSSHHHHHPLAIHNHHDLLFNTFKFPPVCNYRNWPSMLETKFGQSWTYLSIRVELVLISSMVRTGGSFLMNKSRSFVALFTLTLVIISGVACQHPPHNHPGLFLHEHAISLIIY